MKTSLVFLFLFQSLAYADTYINICDRGEVGKRIAGYVGEYRWCHRASVEKMAQLKELDISLSASDDPIYTLPSNAFEGLSNLRVINLKFNSIKRIEDGAFAGLHKLETLNLSYNDLERINDKTFSELKALKHLYLNQNDLSEISDFAFYDLTNLEELWIFDNEVNYLADQVFRKNKKLRTLVLSSNRFRLKELPSSIGDLSELETLDLSASGIEPPFVQHISKLQKLTRLDLSHCKLSDLPEDTFWLMPNLRKLYLKSTGLGPDAPLPINIFRGLHKLETLDLSMNSIDSLPSGIFDDLHNLTWLTLFQNRFESLPPNTFLNLVNLESLFLGMNPIKNLPSGIFDDLHNLTEIHLRQTELESLPKNAFLNLVNLRLLDLRETNIDKISRTYTGLTPVTTIWGVEVTP